MEDTKIASEKQMRRAIILQAKAWGCEKEVRQIFDRYDRLLKNCSDPLERYQIGVMANAELHKFMSLSGPLVCNGQLIIPADQNWKPENSS